MCRLPFSPLRDEGPLATNPTGSHTNRSPSPLCERPKSGAAYSVRWPDSNGMPCQGLALHRPHPSGHWTPGSDAVLSVP